MTDLRYLLEMALLLAIPFVPIVIGVLLRRKFPAAPAAEGAEPAPLTGGQKAGRLAGNILLWGGVAGILFMVFLVLNFKGKI